MNASTRSTRKLAEGESGRSRLHELKVGLRHPILLVRFIQYKLRLVPYSLFFATLMNYRAREDPKKAAGGLWDEMGPLQLNTLIAQGLLPGHTLLDYGCGTLRGGRLFIDYLEPGKYFGVDVSADAIQEGIKLLGPEAASKKMPRFAVVDGTTLSGLQDKFDFILAQSVITHMSTPDIVSLFGHLREIMKPTTRMYATYWDSSEHDGGIVDFTQPVKFFEELGSRCGLTVEPVTGFTHPRNQRLLLIRPCP